MSNCLKLWRFKRKYNFFTSSETVLIRKSDKTLWIADYHTSFPMKGLFGNEPCFYFRRCRKFSNGYIVNWNHTWEFDDSRAFDIYDNREAR